MKNPKIEIYSNKKFVVDKRRLKNMILQMIQNLEKEFGFVELSFLTDEKLFELNKKHLNHQTFTDILTFTYNQEEPVSTEVLISYERAFENSRKFKTTFEQEILRLISHGLLHSLGYKDKTKNQKLKMRKAENDLLKSIKTSEFIKKFEMEKDNNG
jgi:rRNA maturation RNase YbeY